MPRPTQPKRFQKRREVSFGLLYAPDVTVLVPRVAGICTQKIVSTFIEQAGQQGLSYRLRAGPERFAIHMQTDDDCWSVDVVCPPGSDQLQLCIRPGDELSDEFMEFFGDVMRLAYGNKFHEIAGRCRLARVEADFAIDRIDVDDYTFSRADGTPIQSRKRGEDLRRKARVLATSVEAVTMTELDDSACLRCKLSWPGGGGDLDTLPAALSSLRVARKHPVGQALSSASRPKWWTPEKEWRQIAECLARSGLFGRMRSS